MLVVLVLCTFVAFIVVDYYLSLDRALERASPAAKPAKVIAREPAAIGEPVFVAGYELPQQYHYHRGHTWARVVKPDTVTVGMDDFASRLFGKAGTLEVPPVGSWIRQGLPSVRVNAENRSAELVSPIEGEVVEINPEVAQRPYLAVEDPYRSGWIMKIRVSDLDSNLRNLLSGSLANMWMEDTREQLEHRLMAYSGSVLQDGGEPARNFADELGQDEWKDLVETFLMTEAGER